MLWRLVFPILLVLGPGCVTFTRTLPAGNGAKVTTVAAVETAQTAQTAQASPPVPLWQFQLIPHREAAPIAAPRVEPVSAQTPDLAVLTTPPIQAVKSSGYGWRKDPFRRIRKFHSGTDYPSSPGTPIAAAGNGVVVFAGRQRGYGNVVLVDHGSGVVTLYGHLRKIEVQPEATVSAGQQIGQVGQTGRATGPHLHFEVHVDGRPVDPVMALAMAETERSSPEDGKLAALALTSDALSKARAENRSRARPKKRGKQLRRSHGKRPQTLW